MEKDNADPQLDITNKKEVQQMTNQCLTIVTVAIDNDQSPDLIQNDIQVSALVKFLRWITQQIPCLRDCIQDTTETTEPFYKRYKRQLYGLVSIILTIVVIINYQSFKVHCPYSNQETCLKRFIFPQLSDWLFKIVVDCVFAVIQVHFLLHRSTNRFISIGGVLQIMYLYFLSDQTISPTYYIGAINFVHIVFLMVLLIIYFITTSIVLCFKKNRYLVLLFLMIIFCISVLIYIFVLNDSCQDWQKGINGKIQKGDNICTVKTPSFCWYKILDGYFGLSWLFNNCYLSSDAQANFNKYFQTARQTGSYIAFANPSDFSQFERYDSNMQKSVFKYAKGFKTLKSAIDSSQTPDIVFDSQKQRYYIEIQKNQTLLKDRRNAWKRSQNSESPPLVKNVFFLYVDAISRQSVHLKLPDVAKWFKDRTIKKSYQIDPLKQVFPRRQESYQFYRYNSLQAWTQPNQITMFYGIRQDDYYKKNIKNNELLYSIVQNYKKRGYITGSANSMCQTISANFDVNQTQFCHSTRFDHESQSFACDPNFQDPQNFYSNSQGPYSGGKRCLYGKIIADYATQYAESFFETYKHQPKFFSMQLLEGHQGTGEGVKALNRPLSAMLERLQQKGLLKDTMVMLISDHGLHMHGLLYALGVQNVKTQMNLPVLMVDLPPDMNDHYRDKIRFNQQYVVTSKNVHHYLKHIVMGDKYRYKKMSLLSDLTDNNSCRSVDIFEQKFCSCIS